jgi:hypothetical protein
MLIGLIHNWLSKRECPDMGVVGATSAAKTATFNTVSID